MIATAYEFPDGQVILCADGRYPVGSISVGRVTVRVFVPGNGKPDELTASFRGVEFNGYSKRGWNQWLYPPERSYMAHQSLRSL